VIDGVGELFSGFLKDDNKSYFNLSSWIIWGGCSMSHEMSNFRNLLLSYILGLIEALIRCRTGWLVAVRSGICRGFGNRKVGLV